MFKGEDEGGATLSFLAFNYILSLMLSVHDFISNFYFIIASVFVEEIYRQFLIKLKVSSKQFSITSKFNFIQQIYTLY